MARITEAPLLRALTTDGVTLVNQGGVDYQIESTLAYILSWGVSEGLVSKGLYTQGLDYTTEKDFTYYQGKAYLLKNGVALPYTTTTASPVDDPNLSASTTQGNGSITSALRYPSEFGGIPDDISLSAQQANDAAFQAMKTSGIKKIGFEGTYYTSQQLSFLDTDVQDWNGLSLIGFGEDTGISCLTPGTHTLLIRDVIHNIDMLKLSALTINDESTPNGYALQWRQVKDSTVGTLWLNNGWWFGEYDPVDPREGSQRNNINNVHIENARYWALYLRSFGITDKTKGTYGNNFNNVTINNSNSALTLDGGDGGANAAVHSNNFNNYVADSCDTGFHCETSDDNHFSNFVLRNPTNIWSMTDGITPYKQKFLYSFSSGNKFDNVDFGEYEGEFFSIPEVTCKDVVFDSCTQKAAWVFSNTSLTTDDVNKNCFTGFRFSNHKGQNKICIYQNDDGVNSYNNFFRDWTFENSEFNGGGVTANIVNIQNSTDININDRTIFRDCGNVFIRSENIKWQDGSKYRSLIGSGVTRLILRGTGDAGNRTLQFEGDYQGEDYLDLDGFDIINVGNTRIVGSGAGSFAISVGNEVDQPSVNLLGNLTTNYATSFNRDLAKLYGLHQLPTTGFYGDPNPHIRDYRDGSIVAINSTSVANIYTATGRKYDDAWVNGTSIIIVSNTGTDIKCQQMDTLVGSDTGKAFKIMQVGTTLIGINLG